MISVIVCHRNEALLAAFKKNLQQTIGTDYELLVIDNRQNDYSIFQAYNEGVSMAKGSLLCFCHEDILFHTNDWGRLAIRHFEDKRLGMIGVAGGNRFPSCPSPWWTNAVYNDHLINLIQRWPTKAPKQPYYTFLNEEKTLSKAYNNPTGENAARAVTVDGLWFCIPKAMFDHIAFDDQTYTGFHCYDTDISLQVFQTHDVRVVYDILIEHLSDATSSKDFVDSCIAHFRKWKHVLPALAKTFASRLELDRYEYGSLLEFAYSMQSMGYHSDREIKSVIRESLAVKRFNFRLKEAYLLYLWSVLGYKLARYPYFLIRKLLK